MNSRISSLLDDYQDDSVVLAEDTPLSGERIKKRTMEKIRSIESRRKPILPKIIAVAAAVSVLAVTVAAAEYIWGVRDWFGSAFNFRAGVLREYYEREDWDSQLQGNMMENQLALLESMGQMKNESVTCDGGTITLMAVCSDEYIMYLYFDVQAPEGVTLPDGLYYSFKDPAQRGSVGKTWNITVADRKMLNNPGLQLQALADDDPTDNQKRFIATLTSTSRTGIKSAVLNDGTKKVLNIKGLYAYEADEYNRPRGEKQTLFQGDFSFDITNETESRRIDVDVKGITYDTTITWHPEGEASEEERVSVVVDSLRIGPLTAEWISHGSHWASGHFEVYMKDGTMAVCGGGTVSSWGSKTVDILRFYLPVDIGQIDYVLVNGEHRIYVNQ